MSYQWRLKYGVPEGRPIDARLAAVCRLAITAQFGVNLSGIVKDFAEVTGVLWDLARDLGEGTAWVNEHPLCVLYAVKVADLTGACMADLHTYKRCDEWLKAVMLRLEKEKP